MQNLRTKSQNYSACFQIIEKQTLEKNEELDSSCAATLNNQSLIGNSKSYLSESNNKNLQN
jgi:hypothetical protein